MGVAKSLGMDIDFHIQRVNRSYLDSSAYKVFIDTWEPSYSVEPEHILEQFVNQFDLVITKYEGLHKRYPGKCIFKRGLEVHCRTDLRGYDVSKKEASVSFLTGRTAGYPMPGYDQRVMLWRHRFDIRFHTRFWTGYRNMPGALADPHDQYPLPNDNRDVIYQSMFNICIENSMERNYITEKIKDCFITMTLPIYIGCPNISDYFNLDGIIIAKDWRHILDICNNLSENDYYSRMDAMVDNFKMVSADPYELIGREIALRTGKA
jgi:hypothetical protein